MSILTGKEALIALANGESVEMADSEVGMDWTVISKHGFLDEQKISAPCLPMFFEESERIQFRLKPRTISINGIEMPAPADDKDYHHQGIWILNSLEPKEYGYVVLDITDELPRYWWRTEEEIKQVVAALRKVFGGAQ